jgi:sulfatase modifying factor 1
MRSAGLLIVLLLGSPAALAQIGERVSIGSFSIDRTEVTQGQFRAYASQTGSITMAERSGGGFEYAAGWERRPGWTVYQPFGQPVSPREPAAHVTWAEAAAYCRWAGGRLPMAAEWRQAAYTETRPNPPPPFKAGQTYRFPMAEPRHANTSASDPWPRSAEAGATTPGVNGLYDMGGNLWEWAADGPDAGSRYTMGGSWWYGPDQTANSVEASKPADFFAVYIGFRCVYPAAG